MKQLIINITISIALIATISCTKERHFLLEDTGSVDFISEELVINPSGYAPLTAGIKLINREDISVRVTVSSIYEGQEDFSAVYAVEKSENPVWIPVLGLYPDAENNVEILITGEAGNIILDYSTTLKTRPVFNELPSAAEVRGRYPEQDEMIFAGCSLRGLFNLQQGVVFDRYGNVRWYSQFPLGYHPLEIIDGDIICGDHGYRNLMHRINLLGFTEEKKAFGNDENGFSYIHHDIVPMGNGHYLLTVNNINSIRRENYLVEFDFKNALVVKSWDLEEILPNVDDLYADLPNSYYKDKGGDVINDNIHINSIDYDPLTGDILITSQRFGAALMSYDGELLWMLAPHKLKRRNTEPDYNYLEPSNRIRNINIPTWPPENDGSLFPELPAYSYLADFDEDDPSTWRLPASGRLPAYAEGDSEWNYSRFLLNPVLPNGEAVSEEAAESGLDISRGDEVLFSWPFRPHTARFAGAGRIIIFDNGFSRNFVPFVTEESYSRAVCYGIERNDSGYGGTVRMEWDYIAEEGWQGFSLFLGEAEPLENGNFLMDFGGIGKADNIIRYFNRWANPSILIKDLERYRDEVEENIIITEVKPPAVKGGKPQEIFRLTFPASRRGAVGSYRATKLNLYEAWGAAGSDD